MADAVFESSRQPETLKINLLCANSAVLPTIVPVSQTDVFEKLSLALIGQCEQIDARFAAPVAYHFRTVNQPIASKPVTSRSAHCVSNITSPEAGIENLIFGAAVCPSLVMGLPVG